VRLPGGLFNNRLYKRDAALRTPSLKDFRRIATRYDRLARNFLASVCLITANTRRGCPWASADSDPVGVPYPRIGIG
jgi:hypothetical protein